MNKMLTGILCGSLSAILMGCGFLCLSHGRTDNVNRGNPGVDTTEKPAAVQGETWLTTQAEFDSPSNCYRAMRMLHDRSSLHGNSAQEMALSVLQGGFGGAVTNTRWNSNYLKDEKELKKLDEFVQAMRQAGGRTWLYDECGYPSGSAGGLVSDEAYRAQILGQFVFTGSGMGTQSVTVENGFEKIATVLLSVNGTVRKTDFSGDGKTVSFQGAPGTWTAYVYAVQTLKSNISNGTGSTKEGYYPNLLNPDAVKEFLDVTYVTYGNTITDFSSAVEAFFTDEPALEATRNLFTYDTFQYPVVPFESRMYAAFEKTYGVDLYTKLNLLFDGTSEEAIRLRAQFYHLVGDTLAETYFGQISDWCEGKGVKASGHLLLEEQIIYHVPLYGNYMEVSSRMGYPGFDVLNVRPAAYRSATTFGAKYASSAAWLNGKSTVMVEICPVNGSTEFDEHHLAYALGTATFIYFDGGNQIMSYYSQANTQAETGNAFNLYVGRLGAMVKEAVNTAEIAVYYPVDSVAGDYLPPVSQSVYKASQITRIADTMIQELTNALRAEGQDYAFLDDAAIAAGSLKDGRFRTGNCSFSTVYVPCASVMALDTLKALKAMQEGGIKVIFLAAPLSYALSASDQAAFEAVKATFAADSFVSQVATAVKKMPAPEFRADSKETVWVSSWEKNGQKFYFLANTADEAAECTISMDKYSKWRIYDPVNGTILESDASTVTVEGNRALFVQPIA